MGTGLMNRANQGVAGSGGAGMTERGMGEMVCLVEGACPTVADELRNGRKLHNGQEND